MIPHQALQEILRRSFPGISESEAQKILATGKTKRYLPGVDLTHEGVVEKIFYIILEGEVQVTKRVSDQESRMLKHLYAGDFFGEMALIHNAPRAATVTTTIPTTVIEINKDAFSALLQTSNSVSIAMVREVSRRLRENDEMAIEDLRVKAGELAIAYQQLAEMDYARHEFLTMIAHELRTPLMAANGYMQLIRSGMLPPDTLKNALETVANHLKDITTLTNDILFLQEMDLILPEFQSVDIGNLVENAVEQQRLLAEQCCVQFNTAIAPDLPPISADLKSLERAILAVINNAVKFSPDGGPVNINVAHEQNQIKIIVEDHGVGIPAEAHDRIFERFFHLDSVGGHLFRGLGLGLSIAKQVIHQHGGAINVQSRLGQGCTVTITLPVQSKI